MARLTPAMYSKGSFGVALPFLLKLGEEYTVTAIRSFDEIRRTGLDPLALIYTPAGLTEERYQKDLEEGAAIVTLQAATEKPLYIPDTFITSLPDNNSVPYSYLIVSVALGAFPDSYDTALLEEKLAGVVTDYIGVEPQVQVGRLATTGIITPEQHQQITIARQAAVKMRETDRAIALRQAETVAEQAERIRALEEIILRYQQETA